MQHLINYQKFNENIKPVVSFDFDGVLHTSMITGTLHPINFVLPETWQKNISIIKILEKEKEQNRVIIVTARDTWNKPQIKYFLDLHNISVDDIITTDNRPKRDFLLKNNVIRHYDDNPNLKRELVGTGIELIFVVDGNPKEKVIL